MRREQLEPVRKTIVVETSQVRAFQVFTEGLDRWWPRNSHHIGKAAVERCVLEPREGGRWYERGVDGTECEWGKVLRWEPPSRVVLAWQIDGNWQFDPELITEVEVRFIPEGPARTRVELEHRDLERFGDRAEAMHKTFESPGGWPGLLQRFANEATASGP